MRSLPPLAAVRVFEAAARHENFTTAARELGMTQAAVSHQIRLIEASVGQPLFRRERQRVFLTEAARRAAIDITKAMTEMETAFANLRADDDRTLTISTTQTFANTWLAWRLGRFQMSHPEIAVRLSVADTLSDFGSDGVDVSIRSGAGGWPGLQAHRLLVQDFTPMCSPAFLAAHGGHIEPADLPRLPLISPDDPSWARWLRDAGLSQAVERPLQGVRMDSQANEGHAAMAGQGIAMLTPFFWRQDTADGRLVQLFPHVSTLGVAYWIVYPEHRRLTHKIRRFRDWLLAEITAPPAPATP
jgi:LysR family glycine cleavage system transcriptional activator